MPISKVKTLDHHDICECS